ncbi:MAG: hypothetical protein OZSIB_2262 [Candidatus Ozemobacter sibiricus]|uniref:CAAX prenyl protease 2/Lysostaphin resistance protein A-like domain-containing protein n=1 Tax=Candidatus Ozemobacter sibiricus TaxID=2268124 RepID=A0A367ZTC0_9BACT|nr:MAG: hypothetical protein OZSIB_2262 [Candidatus Ozemobacter sibiricus]
MGRPADRPGTPLVAPPKRPAERERTPSPPAIRDDAMPLRRPTPAEAREFWTLFIVLLPFYLWLLPREGPPQMVGFGLVAAVIGYIVWRSPHRRPEPAARRSLLEAVAMLAWSMAVIWGILPWGPVGKVVGNVLIGLTVAYILFFARRLRGDSWEAWGLGSPWAFLAHLRHGEGRHRTWLALALANLALLTLCGWAGEVVQEIVRKAIRKAIGFRGELHLSFPARVLLVVPPMNFFFACFRYDNARQAARLLSWYFLGGLVLVVAGGYLYIYRLHGGWVELRPLQGLTGVGGYALWGTLQELLFLSYFNTRIRQGLTSPYLSALLTAVVFSLYHLTAYTLMAICFFVMIVWALIFQAAPNLFLLGIVHGISGGFGTALSIEGMPPIKIKASVGPFNR